MDLIKESVIGAFSQIKWVIEYNFAYSVLKNFRWKIVLFVVKREDDY